MNSKIWSIVFIVIYPCLERRVLCATNSRLEEKVDALDNLVRLLNEKVDRDIEDRKLVMKKFSETQEYVEKSIRDIAHNEAKAEELESLSRNIVKNNEAVKQISKEFFRMKKAIMEERRARSTDANAVSIEQLTRLIEKKHNDINNMIERRDDNMNNLVQLINDNRKAAYLAAAVVKKEDIPIIEDFDIHNSDSCLETRISDLYTHLQSVKEFRVTLAGGRNDREGRVEIDYQGRHGTVCDDYWDNNDAKVVCRMLGFTGGIAFQGPVSFYGHRFGEGTGEIMLSNVDCSGDEMSLFSCYYLGIGGYGCDHREDAGVRCK